MSAGHTPGPWIFEPHGAFRSDICGEMWPLGYVSTAFPEPIFALHEVDGSLGVRKLVANARLIAAAPELLEALEAAMHDLDPTTSSWQDGRAAIAKARGEA